MTATLTLRSTSAAPTAAARPASARSTRRSFSFSRHYDPANTHHGLLLVDNDDTVKPGTGFETHPHQDMEIVALGAAGSLVHQDCRATPG